MTVSRDDLNGAEKGDLVEVEQVSSARYGLPRARVIQRLGSLTSEKAVSMIAIHAHEIPHIFPPDVLAEAEAAKPATMAGREDFRDLPLITIDPADAKDHDDAVYAEPDTDENNPGGVIVTVAIADVAAYVRPGSALDREALKRGNSVYFPDRVVPMLPERISNDLCSLKEGVDRPALAVQDDVFRRGAEDPPHFPPRHDEVGGKARLPPGAGGDRRRAGRCHPSDPRDGAEAALGGLRGAEARPQRAPAAGTRPARAQDPAEARRHGRQGHRSRPPRCAQAHRGVHDPGERRRGRDAGGEAPAARLPRPRRALARQAGIAARVPGDARHVAGARRAADAAPVQRHTGAGAGRRQRGAGQRGGAAHAEPGDLFAGESRPFRPQSPPLRAFHLADPALCRPDRPPRADLVAEARARTASRAPRKSGWRRFPG